jgi:hypothetical protein
VDLTEGKREALRQIKEHRTSARLVDEFDVYGATAYEVNTLYERILQGERNIHEVVTAVEREKEVIAIMSEQEKEQGSVSTPGQEQPDTATTPDPAEGTGGAQAEDLPSEDEQ